MENDSDFEKLIDYYRHEYYVMSTLYQLMGCLLNNRQIEKRIKVFALDSCYVYGGNFIGIQCYRALMKYIPVKAIVDKKKNLKYDDDNIEVIDVEELRKIYRDEKIIITPIQYAREIKEELSSFVAVENILFIGEFVLSD